MALLTANKFPIPSGAPSGGNQPMVSFDALLLNNTSGVFNLNPDGLATADFQWNWDSGVGIFADATDGKIGIGTSTLEGILNVVSDVASFFKRTTASTTGDLGIMNLIEETSGDMVDTFGPRLNFLIRDDALVNRDIGSLTFVRDGADTEGKFILRAGTNGGENFLTISSTGITTLNPSSLTTANLQWNWLSGVGIFARASDSWVGFGHNAPTELIHAISSTLTANIKAESTLAGQASGLKLKTTSSEWILSNRGTSSSPVGNLELYGENVLQQIFQVNGKTTFNASSTSTADFQWNWDTGVGIFARASDGWIGIGTSSPESGLHVSLPNQPTTIQRNHDAVSTITDPLVLVHKTSQATISEGFGTMIRFGVEEPTGGYQIVGRLGFIRGTLDTEGKFSLRTGTGGNEEFFTIGENSLTTLNVARLSTGGLELLKQSSGSVISANASTGVIGFGIDQSLVEGAFHFKSSISSLFAERLTSATNTVTTMHDVLHTTSADMATGFGSAIRFGIRDTANVHQVIGHLDFLRGSADTEGTFRLRGGTGGNESFITVGETGLFSVVAGDLDISATGKGLGIKGGAVTDSIGLATLVAGTVTIANTNITATDRIKIWVETAGGTQGFLSSTRIASTSFTINSTSVLETSTVGYQIIRTL